MKGRALEVVEGELERGRLTGSDGERARVEFVATCLVHPEGVEDFAKGHAGPQAGEERLTAGDDVPAD